MVGQTMRCLFVLCALPLSAGLRETVIETSGAALQVGALKQLLRLVAGGGANASAPVPSAAICADLRDVTGTSPPELRKALEAWPHGKLWASESFDAKWRGEVGLQRPPGFQEGESFQGLIEFIGGGETLGVTAKGGAVRDLFLEGVKPTDIDIGWSADTQGLKEAVRSKFHAYCDNPEGEWGEAFQYLLFGERESGPGASPFDPLEGNHKKAFTISECKPENSVNALEYEPVKQIIIDPTGFGVSDVCRMEFRLPPDCLSAETWLASNGGQTALRFYKMYQKGFQLADDRDFVFLFESLDLQARNAIDGQDALEKEAREFFVELKKDTKRVATKESVETVDEAMKRAVIAKIDAIGADITKGYVKAMISKKVGDLGQA